MGFRQAYNGYSYLGGIMPGHYTKKSKTKKKKPKAKPKKKGYKK
tara:strand:+ start:428 stop:559 length:132 start_codon:yes stop_codon:yes gene_type:complete